MTSTPHRAERARTSHKEGEVPALKGLNEQEARKRLDKGGFQVAVRSQESPKEDVGRILEHSVAGEREARKGSKIVLTVGEGPQVVKVPDLVGLTYSEGELEEAGFLVGGVREVSSETVPAGVILDQGPQTGTTLDQGSYVYLTTSIGTPEETTIEP